MYREYVLGVIDISEKAIKEIDTRLANHSLSLSIKTVLASFLIGE